MQTFEKVTNFVMHYWLSIDLTECWLHTGVSPGILSRGPNSGGPGTTLSQHLKHETTAVGLLGCYPPAENFLIINTEGSRGGRVLPPFVCVSVCFSARYLKNRFS